MRVLLKNNRKSRITNNLVGRERVVLTNHLAILLFCYEKVVFFVIFILIMIMNTSSFIHNKKPTLFLDPYIPCIVKGGCWSLSQLYRSKGRVH